MVNIPEFRLHVFEGDTEAFSMRIVVGAAATHTVIFADTLTQVVMSPTWTVPMSITRNEILPAHARRTRTTCASTTWRSSAARRRRR